MSIIVKTQKQLDKALAGDEFDIFIDSPKGVWLELAKTEGHYVELRGSASVRAFDSASVSASGSASVSAFDSASVSAGKYVAVHLHSARVKVQGGVLIDLAALDLSDVVAWAEYHGAEIIDAKIIVYKAVNADLNSGRGFAYPIGERVEALDWKAGDFCGNGLHFSPTPIQAQDYYLEATRFLKVAVRLDELTLISPNDTVTTPKLKAKGAQVLCEVDVHGRELVKAAK